jgi:hypothetical protein
MRFFLMKRILLPRPSVIYCWLCVTSKKKEKTTHTDYRHIVFFHQATNEVETVDSRKRPDKVFEIELHIEMILIRKIWGTSETELDQPLNESYWKLTVDVQAFASGRQLVTRLRNGRSAIVGST